MELHEKLVSAILARDASVAEMCRSYGISRKTVYEWIELHKACGQGGLCDQPRVPRHQPGWVSDSLVDEVLAARHAHRAWGARKLHPPASPHAQGVTGSGGRHDQADSGGGADQPVQQAPIGRLAALDCALGA